MTTTPQAPMTRRETVTPRQQAATRSVVAYVLLAHALAWLACLPLWLDRSLMQTPVMLVCAVLMMFMPSVATLLVLRRSERWSWRAIAGNLGLGLGGTPAHLLIWLGLVAAAVYACVLGALGTSALLGQFDADLRLSGLRALFAQGLLPQGSLPDVPIVWWAVLMLVSALMNGVLNTIPALGEELGWRGFLFPELERRYGAVIALVGSGVIWGLWHAPLILLGYNYPLHPVLGLLAFCVVCTLLTGVFGWVRQRSGSVWPAAYGHGLFNALATTALIVFQRAGANVDTLHGTILGWSGWPVAGVLVVVLLLTGAYASARPSVHASRKHAARVGTRGAFPNGNVTA